MLRDEGNGHVLSGTSKSAEPMEDGPEIRIDGHVPVGLTPRSDNALDYSAGSPTSISSLFSRRRGSEAASSSPMIRQYSLKRSGSNIASLRAAFEHADASSPPLRRFEKIPSRSFSGRSESASNLMRAKDAQIEALEKQLANEIAQKESFESQLKVSQERCQVFEKEVSKSQVRGSQNGSHSNSADEQETRSIQRQLYELKRSISTATRIENQVSDSTFAQEFANLHHELQNFIVNTFRRVKLTKTPQELCESLQSVATPEQQQYLRPLFAAFEPSMKLAALQATAVCILMEIFDEPLLFGLPEQQEWRDNLRETMKTLPAILAPSGFNKWRYLTLDAVRQSVGIDVSVHSASSRLTETICTTLGALTEVEDLGARAASLNSIVMRALQLSHLFRVQRAQYEFIFPAPGAAFQSDMMEDHTIDCEVSGQSTVVCATFPSIIKHGDENGDDMQLSNVVVKAKVLCRG